MAGAVNEEYDFWTCDNCHRQLPVDRTQHKIRVQQRSERVWGTELVLRPIETLTVCNRCYFRAKESTDA